MASHSPVLEATSAPEASASSSSQQKRSRSCSKTPESISGCRSPGSSVGDDACPICLGPFTDKCAAGSCFHNFCLVCLKEWSKQRAVCPLCKQSFTKILYDIKSETDYKEWKVPIVYPNDTNDAELRGLRGALQLLEPYHQQFERRFFGYRSTFSRLFHRRQQPTTLNGDIIPSARSTRQQSRFDRGSSLFRLSIYTNNIWVLPLADITGRYRESSPQLYREQPALTHRLVPWVNRELAALVASSRIGIVLSEIMDLIEQYPIDSREFRQALRPHLGSWTSHFVHEFFNFARSPYDMVGHDNASQYVPRYDNIRETIEDNSDDDVIEIESDGLTVEAENQDLPSRVAREETIGIDGSVFISSDSDSSIRERTNNDDVEASHINYSCDSINYSLNSDSRNLNGSRENITDKRSQPTNSLEEPGPSGISSSSSTSVKRVGMNPDSSSDSDDCLIVNVLKPKKERTPELIQLSSGSEEEGKSKPLVKTVKSKPVSTNDSSKHRKKPRLDRTSFSVYLTGTLNCQRGKDHTYCTKSASLCNPSSNMTESDDDLENCKNESGGQFKSKLRWNRIESESDSDFEIGLSSNSKGRNETSSRLRYHSKSTRKTTSFTAQNHSPSRKFRKDQRHKIKNSSRLDKSTSQSSSQPHSSRDCSGENQKQTSSRKFHNKANSIYKRRRRYSSSSSYSSISSSDSSSTTSTSSSSSSESSSSSSNSDRLCNKSSRNQHSYSLYRSGPRYRQSSVSSSSSNSLRCSRSSKASWVKKGGQIKFFKKTDGKSKHKQGENRKGTSRRSYDKCHRDHKIL